MDPILLKSLDMGSRAFQNSDAFFLSSFLLAVLATSAQYCVSSNGVRMAARASKASSPAPPRESLFGSRLRMMEPRPFSSSVIRFCSEGT